MKQIIFTLQCLCTIWLNIVIIIQLHQLHLWQFKIHDVPVNIVDLTTNNFKLFKYKAVLVGKTADVADGNSFVENTKIVFPLKYLSNFWRTSEISWINCKIHLKLNWIEDWILSSAGDSAKCKIMDAKFHVSIVTLPTTDNVNVTKQSSDGFKRSVYGYQSDYSCKSNRERKKHIRVT